MRSVSWHFAGSRAGTGMWNIDQLASLAKSSSVLPACQEWNLGEKADEAEARCWVLRVRSLKQLTFQRNGSRRSSTGPLPARILRTSQWTRASL
jgi:hypothetical protein